MKKIKPYSTIKYKGDYYFVAEVKKTIIRANKKIKSTGNLYRRTVSIKIKEITPEENPHLK